MRRTGAQQRPLSSVGPSPQGEPLHRQGGGTEASAGPPLVIGSYPILCWIGAAVGALAGKVMNMKDTLLGMMTGLLLGLALWGLAFCGGCVLAGYDQGNSVSRLLEKIVFFGKQDTIEGSAGLDGKWRSTRIDDPHWPEA